MKSAYLVLGVPGNASSEDIEIAFARAKLVYTPDRQANAEGALERFREVKIAYDVLRNPDSRAAHDRKLNAALNPAPAARPVIIVEEASPARRIVVYALLLVGAIFAVGYYISYQNAEAKRLKAAAELAVKARAAKEEQAQKLEAERLDQERATAKALAEASDRRHAAESQIAAARAAAEMRRQEQAALQMQRAVAGATAGSSASLRAAARRDRGADARGS